MKDSEFNADDIVLALVSGPVKIVDNKLATLIIDSNTGWGCDKGKY